MPTARLRHEPRRRAVSSLAALAIAACATLIGTSSAPAASARPSRFVSIWVPYWDSTAGAGSYSSNANADLYTEVSPFYLQAVGSGAVVTVSGYQTQFNKSVTLARSKGLKVIPTITDATGKLGMQQILASSSLRAAHVANLVNAVITGTSGTSWDGIDLDYENFAFTDSQLSWDKTMPLWVQFISDLSTALHAEGKLLSVTIPPVWHKAPNTDYWVYAQDQILPLVDRLRLMVYDWSPNTPSATAPITWVRDVVTHSTAVAVATGQPLTKLILGVPAYGRHWRRAVNG
ncbi:MAG: glycosyl hydrolase family 18 protein, partial [Ilumatobacteraceae bacterium]